MLNVLSATKNFYHIHYDLIIETCLNWYDFRNYEAKDVKYHKQTHFSTLKSLSLNTFPAIACKYNRKENGFHYNSGILKKKKKVKSQSPTLSRY